MTTKGRLELIRALVSKQADEGFSLVELVVVIAVMAVLGAVALPSFLCVLPKARATAALAETVGSSAAAIFSKKENQILRGVELSINHVRGISEGFVFAKAVPIHMGRTMQLWKISIIDENNRDISFAKLTTLTIDK